MALLPMVAIVTAEHRDNIELVWFARGLGMGNFTRKCCAPGPDVTWETPPTHWLTSDAGATAEEVAICQAMGNGDLPPLPPFKAWGVDGLISAEDALAATTHDNFHVYSVSGDVEPQQHCAAVLASEGLIYVPWPPD